MANVVEIVISAQDKASDAFAGIGTALGNIGSIARKNAISVGDFGKNLLDLAKGLAI